MHGSESLVVGCLSVMAWNANVNMRVHNHKLHVHTSNIIFLMKPGIKNTRIPTQRPSVAYTLTYLVVWWRTCAAAEAHQRPPCFCVNRTPVNVFKTNLETQQFPQSPLQSCRRLASVVPHKRAATTRCYLITLAQFAWDTLAKFDAKTFYVWHNKCAWIWYPQYS